MIKINKIIPDQNGEDARYDVVLSNGQHIDLSAEDLKELAELERTRSITQDIKNGIKDPESSPFQALEDADPAIFDEPEFIEKCVEAYKDAENWATGSDTYGDLFWEQCNEEIGEVVSEFERDRE